MRIKISFRNYVCYAQLADTPTSEKLTEALPIRSTVNTWGDEIYFHIPVHCALEENARVELNVGDLAYWPDMPAFCIFFGPTPVSTDEKPVAAGRVNFFGRLENFDVSELREIKNGQEILIEEI